jgi:hypothetical protein
MECIRPLNPKKYDRKSNKWFETAFRNNKGSLSILDGECAIHISGSICGHIRKFWETVPGIIGDPIIYWKFSDALFPAGRYTVEQQTSAKGDPCHCNVHGIPDAELYPLIENRPLNEFTVCDNGNDRPLAMHDLGL